MIDSKTMVPSRYLVQAELGRGGAGVVYKVTDSTLRRLCALKILTGQISETHVLRFQIEAKATALLEHPNIVKILDFGITDTRHPYMVMEYLEGASLSSEIKRRGSLPPSEAIPIFIQICAGLSRAHAADIIHRDVKPPNVMLVKNGGEGVHVKLVDFGIVKFAGRDIQLTHTGVGIGSPPYMSPEQVNGEELDHRSDIYSLGCLMFETLTGKTPFLGKTALETVRMHLNDAPPALSDVSSRKFPAGLEDVVRECLEKDAEQRFNSVEAVAGALQTVLDEISAQPYEEEKVDKYAQRYKQLRAPLAVAVLIGVILVAVAYPIVLKAFERVDAPRQESPNVATWFDQERGTVIPDEVISKPPKYEFVNERFSFTASFDKDIPNFVKDHPDAARVDFARNEYGKISGKSLSYLAKLNSLEYLNLTGCEIEDEDLRFIAKMRNLQQLILNRIDTFDGSGLAYLKDNPKLFLLSLQDNKLTRSELKQVANIKAIREINLCNTFGMTPEDISVLVGSPIESVMFQSPELTDGHVRELVKMKKLKQLLIFNCPQITDKSLHYIAQSNVRNIDLSDNPQLTDKGVSYLLGMKHLNAITLLDCDSVTDGAIRILCKKHNLKARNIRHFEKSRSLGLFTNPPRL